jgi:hypothetical protein
LDGPLPKLCQVIPTSNQDGRQAKNRKKRGMMAIRHNFERDRPKDHPCQVWFNLVQQFQRRFKCDLLSKYAYNLHNRFKSAFPTNMAAKLKIEKRGMQF